MSLTDNLADFASAVGREIKERAAHDHPGIAKAWVVFGFHRQRLHIQSALGVAAIERHSMGRYRLYFSTPLPDEHYCWIGSALSGLLLPKTLTAREGIELQTNTTLELVCLTPFGIPVDAAQMQVTVFC